MLVLTIRDDKSLTNELIINSFEDLLLSVKKQIVYANGSHFNTKKSFLSRGHEEMEKRILIAGWKNALESTPGLKLTWELLISMHKLNDFLERKLLV